MIKIIKAIFHFFYSIIETIGLGLYYLCLLLSKGFFFYFYFLFSIIAFVFRFKFMQKIKDGIKRLQMSPIPFMTVSVLCLFGMFFYVYLYTGNNQMVHIPESLLDDSLTSKVSKVDSKGKDNKQDDDNNGSFYVDDNLYRQYGSIDVSTVDFTELRQNHPDVVAWMIVDGTNINYPIVQSGDNDYYLYHDINGTSKISGWTFMDYRNSMSMLDQNTIFYGHNLLNRTAFGSMANMFTEDWFYSSSHKIVVITEYGRYVYSVFANYYIDPEVYYLQTNFSSDASYQEFLNTLKSRSIFDFGIDLNPGDKIITLSTCTEDNTGRKVVHARLDQ